MMLRDPPIIFLAFGQMLIWAGIYYIFPALLLQWELDLGWSKTDLTAAIAMAVLVSALASPLAGRIIDSGHGAIMMAGSAIVGGIGLLFLSVVVSPWQFNLIWITIGLAMAGGLYEPCFAIVTRARGKNAKRGIILITLIAGFASSISYPLVHILADSLGWRGAVQVFGAIIIFIVAPIQWKGASDLEAARTTPVSANRSTIVRHGFVKGPAFWLLAISFSCLALAHGAALHHLLPILDERDLSPGMAVLAASFIGPMQVAGRLAMMASEKHLSHQAVTLAAFILSGLSIVLLLLSGTSPAFLIGFVILFGSAWGTVSILRPLLALDILGEADFGAKSGALALPFLAASALAPFLASVLWGWGGYDFLLVILLGSIALGCMLYLSASRMAASVRG